MSPTFPHTVEMTELIEKFKQEIWPWMREKQLSLYAALANTQTEAPEKFEVLDKLWTDDVGRAYLHSFIRANGGRIF